MTTSMRTLQFSIVMLGIFFLAVFMLLEQASDHRTVSSTGKTLIASMRKREINSVHQIDSSVKIEISPMNTSRPEVKVTLSQTSTSTTATTPTTISSTTSTTTHPRQQDINNLNKWNYILKNALEAKRKVITFLTKHVVNQHDFEYVRSPVNACVETKPDILFAVLSAPGNFELRERVRNGDIGEFVRTTSNGARLLFFTGAFPCNENATRLQTRLSDEYHNHGDIVQEDFLDVFQNLRLKAVSMLRWTHTYCSDVKYVVRMDDDVVVNVSNIVRVMDAKSHQYPDFIVGSIRTDWRMSRRRSDPMTPKEDYSNFTFPPRFVLGELQGYPATTVSLLYHAAIRSEPILLEDVFLTGICATSVDVPLQSDPDFVFRHKPIPKKKIE
ncbi:unnamed protein product [Lymnaea stagnalis]|uniref:Hexosyltransferase n=1 Tax=Lymnaea stagnalis TaxID=6523 RepID=A0AAV2HYC3_LYMST